MITFDIITIFPEIFDSYFKESILKRAQKQKLIKIRIHNLRKWATDRHQTVDDKPYGGGIGMVMKVEPIFQAVKEIKRKSKIISQKHAPYRTKGSGAGLTKIPKLRKRIKKNNELLE